jgi:hypothetical protein
MNLKAAPSARTSAQTKIKMAFCRGSTIPQAYQSRRNIHALARARSKSYVQVFFCGVHRPEFMGMSLSEGPF